MRYEIRDIPDGGVSVSKPSVIASPKGVAIRPPRSRGERVPTSLRSSERQGEWLRWSVTIRNISYLISRNSYLIPGGPTSLRFSERQERRCDLVVGLGSEFHCLVICG